MAIRKHRVQFKRTGTLHGHKIKKGDVLEVEPDVARRLIESGAAVQFVETPKPAKADEKEKA